VSRSRRRIDPSAWPREKFLAVLFTLLLACAWMVSTAAESHAALRRRHFMSLATWRARAPLPYLAVVGGARGLGRPAPGRALVLVRADSASAAEAVGLCRLAAAGPSPGAGLELRWVELGAGVDPCIARAGARLARPAAPAADTLRARLADARWVLVDEGWRARYSRREVPDVAELLAVARLLETEVAP
jgi:hypothetical protein